MNAIYEVLTAAEAARLWDLEESTIRRALWQDRLSGRKSAGTHLISMSEMYRVYGAMPEHNATQFVEDNLSDEDIEAWHNEQRATQNVTDLLDALKLECIQIWGSRNGPESLSINLC